MGQVATHRLLLDQDEGQLDSTSARDCSRSLPCIHSFMAVQNVPDPTSDGIRSEASNRAPPAFSASMMVSADCATTSSA